MAHSPTPGVHEIDGRQYLVRQDQVHTIRADGTPSRQIVGRITPTGIDVTGNGHEGGHTGRLAALAAGRGRLVQARCGRCDAVIWDPASVARGEGSQGHCQSTRRARRAG
jgi:hypothetical protein